jgi:hypothetical protein
LAVHDGNAAKKLRGPEDQNQGTACGDAALGEKDDDAADHLVDVFGYGKVGQSVNRYIEEDLAADVSVIGVGLAC